MMSFLILVAAVFLMNAAATAQTTGRQRLIVYLVDCGNCGPGQPIDVAKQAGVDLDLALRADSYGLIWFTGANDNTPPDAVKVRVVQVSGSCSANAMVAQAMQAGRAQDIDPSKYNRRLYLLSGIAGCKGSGAASVGQPDFMSYGDYSLRVTRHEAQHSLGQALHDKSKDCPMCPEEEYGDFFSTMGSTGGITSPYLREFFGWLNKPGTPTMQTVRAAGDFSMRPLDSTDTQGNKALKVIAKSGNVYYVSYRSGTGYSAGKPVGVIVEVKKAGVNGIYLAKWINDTFSNAYMAKVGDLLNAPMDSLYIKLTGLTPETATVHIDFALKHDPMAGWTLCGGDSSRCQLPVSGVGAQAARGAVYDYSYTSVGDIFYCQHDAFPRLPNPTVHPVSCYYQLNGGGKLQNPRGKFDGSR